MKSITLLEEQLRELLDTLYYLQDVFETGVQALSEELFCALRAHLLQGVILPSIRRARKPRSSADSAVSVASFTSRGGRRKVGYAVVLASATWRSEVSSFRVFGFFGRCLLRLTRVAVSVWCQPHPVDPMFSMFLLSQLFKIIRYPRLLNAFAAAILEPRYRSSSRRLPRMQHRRSLTNSVDSDASGGSHSQHTRGGGGAHDDSPTSPRSHLSGGGSTGIAALFASAASNASSAAASGAGGAGAGAGAGVGMGVGAGAGAGASVGASGTGGGMGVGDGGSSSDVRAVPILEEEEAGAMASPRRGVTTGSVGVPPPHVPSPAPAAAAAALTGTTPGSGALINGGAAPGASAATGTAAANRRSLTLNLRHTSSPSRSVSDSMLGGLPPTPLGSPMAVRGGRDLGVRSTRSRASFDSDWQSIGTSSLLGMGAGSRGRALLAYKDMLLKMLYGEDQRRAMGVLVRAHRNSCWVCVCVCVCVGVWVACKVSVASLGAGGSLVCLWPPCCTYLLAAYRFLVPVFAIVVCFFVSSSLLFSSLLFSSLLFSSPDSTVCYSRHVEQRRRRVCAQRRGHVQAQRSETAPHAGVIGHTRAPHHSHHHSRPPRGR